MNNKKNLFLIHEMPWQSSPFQKIAQPMQVVICLFILSFHFRLKDRAGRLSFSYADLLAFLFSR
jgi:hypothetical protein